MEPFETKRLLLRPLTLSDLDDLHTLYGDRELMRFVTGDPRSFATSRERLQKHIEDHRNYGFGFCAAILKKTKTMIGRCGLEPRPRPEGLEAEAAWLLQKDYWGQGLATEFGLAMVPKAFGGQNLVRIYARADEANIGSIRVMQKIGMRFVGAVPGAGVEYEMRNP